jgi:hypothetical protein
VNNPTPFHCLSSKTNCATTFFNQRDSAFVPALIALFRHAYSFRFGEEVGQLLVDHAQWLNLEDLTAALYAWSDNDQR